MPTTDQSKLDRSNNTSDLKYGERVKRQTPQPFTLTTFGNQSASHNTSYKNDQDIKKLTYLKDLYAPKEYANTSVK